MKESIHHNSCQRMSRADVAAYFGRSLPWVDKAAKSGLIPPPIKIGAPFWTLPIIEKHIEKLAKEAVEAAQQHKMAA